MPDHAVARRRLSHTPNGRPTARPQVTLHPSTATIHAAIVAAALVATADGHVAPRERRSLLRLLRHHGVLARWGRSAPMALFDEAVRDTPDAAPLFAAVVGSPCADLVTQAATHVALADGVTWPQEIAIIDSIRDRLRTPAEPAR
ncbi:MAG: TerB family tellurite resistance protein [Rhodospirillales bacterium]|nr:TerB family tellurite resistance protein [Rhodospirillales bacterium]MBN8896888.1 TerB family tellurite resistance protein [Rhodospirillales bacterium]